MKTSHYFFAVVVPVLLAGCARMERMEGRMQEAESRLDRVEGRVDRLEEAVRALEDAYRDGKIITSVSRIDATPGQWDIVFSDGSDIVITDGADGATGPAGPGSVIVPLLRVDTEGYMTVSYDEGVTYSRLLDENGHPLMARGDKGDQGDKGRDGVCVRVGTNEGGNYVLELYYPDAPDAVIKTIVTPYSSAPATVISGISQDERSREITLSMADGTVFTFNKTVHTPTSIVLAGVPVVRLSEGGTAAFEFRVNPSDAVFNYNVSAEGCEIELDRTGAMTRAGYVTPPTHYRLAGIEPVYNESGVLKQGQYRAVVRDGEDEENYDDTAALVMTVDDGSGRKVQISSSAAEIRLCDNLFTAFAFRAEDNPGKVLADVTARIEGHEVTLDTPFIMDLTSLIPTFATKGDRVFAMGTEQVSGFTACDFSVPVKYSIVSAACGTMEYTVRIRRTGLPVLYIDTPEAAPVTSKETWTEGSRMRLLRPDGTEDYVSDALSIRGRGNTSWTDFPKKPYALKLDKKAELLGMPKHKRWCLLANWIDRTLMRNDIAFHLSGLTGLAWAPRGQFVELVMNGEYAGNYYLCEQIKVDKNRVNIKEMTAEDVEGEALTGGYLLELDTYFDELNKFHSAVRELPYMFKSPDDDVLTPAQFAYLENYVNTFEQALYDDEAFARGDWLEMVDLPSFADWWLVHTLLGNPEPAHPKSCYMYKDRGGKLTAGPVWDFDVSFCARYDLSDVIYYGRLFQSPAFKAVIKQRWEMLKPAFDTIPDYIRSKAGRLEVSNTVNTEMWPIDNGWTIDFNYSYDDAIAFLIETFRTNCRFIEEKMAAL